MDVPPTSTNDSNPRRLSALDEAALDSIVERGFDPASDASSDSRSATISQLLSLLEPSDTIDEASRSLMVDVVMARARRQGGSASASQGGAAGRIGHLESPLQEGDARAIDHLVEAEWQGAPGPRASAALELCQLVESDIPIEGERRDSLVGSTLDRIQEQIDRSSQRMRLEESQTSVREFRPSGLRLADLASVAAVVLVGFAVLWPMLVNVREQARIAEGAANLSSSALGFTLYAADHQDRLPQANASFLQGRWWDVGDPERSHSANLFTLVRENYASMHELSSPGNPDAPTHRVDPSARDWRRPEEVSFSYQLFTTTPRWGENPNLVVLTDRSPAIERARRGESFSPHATSLNHPGFGQHVLFGDGRVIFLRAPILPSGDHLWIPRSLEGVTGPIEIDANQRPESRDDAYVGP